ncbi:GPI mannosyltransferase 2 [Penicillium angulare]|uniref:GPI mannosyltransferase 2 n=1 Tax=Penicillium angulare TaxID=116970 RepID=UPI0025406DFD|nr:GPI mannosyltransferase 2 [Penicillium angulare]KAJ5280881.1 GPI mannosyltransferase 2 [Penicillium angulare]
MTAGTPAALLRLENPIRSLTNAFWLWKALLFIVVTACPGPGYDTSTTLIPYEGADISTSLPWPLKLARWDAVYFLHIAENGYVFEQEWAFSYPRVLGFFASGIRKSGGQGGPVPIALIGVVLSHVTHYLSVLALYRLSANIFGHTTVTQRLICFLSSALHIICPAGAFLSAPYGESLFSFLNISGFYLYSSSLISERNDASTLRDLQVLLSGGLFGIATLVRSNGILSGVLFAYDAILLAWDILTQGLSHHKIRRLVIIGLGGICVALGMIVPQIQAYHTYCMGELDRPWCGWTMPSIYTWVQGHYCPGSMLCRLAVTQGLLAVLALTSYHIQIVNRICSGYPLWYWYLVSIGLEGLQDPRKNHRSLALAAQAMAAYALIQGVLYGSFLPPA